MTVSNIRRMSESSKVEGGGTSAVAAGSTNSSAIVSLVEKGGGGATPEISTLGRLELALTWAALCLKKVAPMGVIIWTGSNAGNSTKPRCNRI